MPGSNNSTPLPDFFVNIDQLTSGWPPSATVPCAHKSPGKPLSTTNRNNLILPPQRLQDSGAEEAPRRTAVSSPLRAAVSVGVEQQFRPLRRRQLQLSSVSTTRDGKVSWLICRVQGHWCTSKARAWTSIGSFRRWGLHCGDPGSALKLLKKADKDAHGGAVAPSAKFLRTGIASVVLGDQKAAVEFHQNATPEQSSFVEKFLQSVVRLAANDGNHNMEPVLVLDSQVASRATFSSRNFSTFCPKLPKNVHTAAASLHSTES